MGARWREAMKRVASLLLIVLVACGPRAPTPTPDLRATVLRQIDQFEAQFGANGGQDAEQQADWLLRHPELRRYHAWYFGADSGQVGGAFARQLRDRTPPRLLRDPALLDRYLASVAQQR